MNYHATWLPNLPMKLGDFGRFDDNIFHKFGNIRDFNFQFSAELGVSAANQELTSSGTRSLWNRCQWLCKRGPSIYFGKKYGFYILAANCQVSLMNDLATVQANVVTLFKAKGFKDMHLVNEVLAAESSTVVVSLD